ncbi:hypothetical protein DE146DRAFT_444682 [Phaeosphaeria sp. MPI-PUGE-AT-0046c]|nr:hypothetical protein DE146DRAFT_444682 [Phaeosphaeria sp. MPI-PUGE-AT-0046c]
MATFAPSSMPQARQITLHTDRQRKRTSTQTTAVSNRRSYKTNKTRYYGTRDETLSSRDTGPRASAGKTWHSLFNTRRVCYRNILGSHDSERPAVDGGLVNTSDLLDEFLCDDEDAIPSWEARTVRRFFEGENQQGSTKGASATWAWLDDREYVSGHSRPSPRALDVSSLRAALGRRRYGHAHLPDGDRRLIYVSELDPMFILALAEATQYYEKRALQDAVCKHIACSTYKQHMHSAIIHRGSLISLLKAICHQFTQTQQANDTEDELRLDFFAADRDADYVKDANKPIWDARTYWLQIVAIRCQLILKEWLYMVHTIEERMEILRATDPCSNNDGSVHLEPEDIRKSLHWTLQAMQLLRKLLDSLSTTLRAYERFDAPDGDNRYFSDMAIDLVKNSMKETFEQLADLHLKLTSLDDSCKRFATHLGRTMDLESNVVARKSNGIQEHTQRLAESTIELNTEIRTFNEISSEAARANQADAAKTSLSTRVNVELLLLTTPFGIVLQYFGSEKDIFSFARNTKTFLVSTLILMLVLRVLALLLEHSDKLLRLSPWKLPFHHRTSISPKEKQGSDSPQGMSHRKRLVLHRLANKPANRWIWDLKVSIYRIIESIQLGLLSGWALSFRLNSTVAEGGTEPKPPQIFHG